MAEMPYVLPPNTPRYANPFSAPGTDPGFVGSPDPTRRLLSNVLPRPAQPVPVPIPGMPLPGQPGVPGRGLVAEPIQQPYMFPRGLPGTRPPDRGLQPNPVQQPFFAPFGGGMGMAPGMDQRSALIRRLLQSILGG